MADGVEGDFTASTGDIFGRRGKGKRNDNSSRKKHHLADGASNKDEKESERKRPKAGGLEREPEVSKTDCPSRRVVSQVFRGINVADYFEARALEVSNTFEALKEAAKCEGKRVLQRLPRHMRRRAASYDARRIPRSQRKMALKEVKDNPAKKGKMPSRKHRRRPKNLLEEYNRRKRNHAWLETHIWHAKRFKMTERWGYKLAEEPCDKGLRSAYRASSNGCLMQDMSCHGCVEINAPEHRILAVFQHVTGKDEGPRHTCKRVISGERACTISLYHYDCHPYRAIGPVEVLWKPHENREMRMRLLHEKNAETQRSVWIWCHPASQDEVFELFKDALQRLENDQSLEGETQMEVDEASLFGSRKDLKLAVEDESEEKSEAGGKREGKQSGIEADQGEGVENEERLAKDDATRGSSNGGKSGCECKSLKTARANGDGREAVPCEDKALKKGMGQEAMMTLPAVDDTMKEGDQLGERCKLKDDDSHEMTEAKPAMHSKTFVVSPSIVVKSLKLDFVKFRLTGPLAHRILVNSLQLHEVIDTDVKSWWGEFYGVESNRDLLRQSIAAWNALRDATSPGELPPRAVLALTVLDPRMNIPIKKTWPGKDDAGNISSTDNAKKISLLVNWSSGLSHSPIWEKGIRTGVKDGMITEAALNKKRSEMLDAGKRLEIGEDTARIPILLIQRPGVQNPTAASNNYGSGWDVIIPSGWGMQFLVSFVYRGAHIGGLREERNMHLEGQIPYFPKEFPDTKSGELYMADEKSRKEEAFNRRPPSKRANHERFGICSPFSEDWQAFVSEWKICCKEVLRSFNSGINTEDTHRQLPGTIRSPPESHEASIGPEIKRHFYVLRERVILIELQGFLNGLPKRGKAENMDSSKFTDRFGTAIRNLYLNHEDALILVSFQGIGRGEAKENALISIPTRDDLEALAADKKCNGPMEPLHKGPKIAFQTVADMLHIDGSRLKRTGQCKRWTIGQVTSGRYSLRTGKGAGVGFVTALGLVGCLEAQTSKAAGCIVLLRNTDSQQYRYARLNVIP